MSPELVTQKRAAGQPCGCHQRNFESASQVTCKKTHLEHNKPSMFCSNALKVFRFSMKAEIMIGEFQPGLKFWCKLLHAQFQPGCKTQISVGEFTVMQKKQSMRMTKFHFQPPLKK